jgi:hypothetical protein
MGRADGLGSGCGVRGLPSSYASSRVAATTPAPHEAAGRGGALRPVRESEVFGPGGTQAWASADHSKLSTDDEVRQLQGFDQGLDRGQGFAYRGREEERWVG